MRLKNNYNLKEGDIIWWYHPYDETWIRGVCTKESSSRLMFPPMPSEKKYIIWAKWDDDGLILYVNCSTDKVFLETSTFKVLYLS